MKLNKMEQSEQTERTYNPNNRKRKGNFLRRMKNFKKRSYDNGELEKETYEYVYNLLITIKKQEFELDSDKSLFVDNVYKEIEDKISTVACNQIGSRLLEELIPFFSDDTLDRLISKLGEDLRQLCADRVASHVIDKLLDECKKRKANETFNAFIVKVSKFLLNNLEDYMYDVYGNHVIRSALRCLANIPKPKEEIVDASNDEIDDNFKEIIADYGNRLINWPQFNEFPAKEITSGLLQVLLTAIAKVDSKLKNEYIKKLIKESFTIEDENSLPNFYFRPAVVRMFETCIEFASDKRFAKIYEKYIQNRAIELISRRETSFFMRKFIDCCDTTTLETLLAELEDKFDKLIEPNSMLLLLAIAKACRKHSTKELFFMNNVMKAFNCFQPIERQTSILKCLCLMMKHDECAKHVLSQSDRFNMNGSLIIQEMLQFKKPIKIVNSVLSLQRNELIVVCCNMMGSHILNAFYESSTVGEKSREKLANNMKGIYTNLASDKYGSRCFDVVWGKIQMGMKLVVMRELAQREASWVTSLCGKIIASKIQYGLYKTNSDNWKQSFDKEKRNDLFHEVVEK